MASNYHSKHTIHCEGFYNPCTSWSCNLLQELMLHLDIYLQHKAGKCLNIGTIDCNQLLGQEKKKCIKLKVAFKNFRFSSLLFQLSLLLRAAKEEDKKKHLLLCKHLIKCAHTQGTFSKYSLARDLYLPLADS